MPVTGVGSVAAVDPVASLSAALTTATATLSSATSSFAPIAGSVGPQFQLQIVGTAAGGLDTSDSTPRIRTVSWQSPHGPNVGGYGQTLRLDVMHPYAKNLIVWRMPQTPSLQYNASTNPLTDVVWMGAHYQHYDPANPTDPSPAVHGHWSVEVPKADGSLISRFEIRILNQSTLALGVDHTNTLTYASDFTIRAAGIDATPCKLRIAGDPTVDKIMEFTGDPYQGSTKYWDLRVSSSDSSFRILRWTADNASVTQLVIDRSSGQMASGRNAFHSGSQFALDWNASIHGFTALPSGSPGSNAGFAALMTATTDRGAQYQVSTDSVARLVIFADGKHEWGPGGSTSRDTNLYRKAADQLGTDDTLFMANISQPSTPTGGGVLFVNAGALKYIGSSGTVTTLGAA
jgi:hypothetical protein